MQIHVSNGYYRCYFDGKEVAVFKSLTRLMEYCALFAQYPEKSEKLWRKIK